MTRTGIRENGVGKEHKLVSSNRRERQGRSRSWGWLGRLRKKVARTLGSGPALFRQMGIPVNDAALHERGLIIVQIDGLSHGRFQKALRKGQLKYVRKLLRRKRLKPYRYLSQIPTSTPAFQAGMFYGDNENIPGFQFYDKKEKRQYFMGSADSAYSVEQCFRKPGLLRGGSVFSCVYTGGAEASLFIFSSLTAPKRWRFALRLWDILLLTLLHIMIILRIAGMAVVELAVGLVDCIKRIWKHGRVSQELEQVAIRVGLSVIGREIITLGAVIDIHRHMPVIYVNYLGYDEHSHLRGPDSRFARWNLRAIDRCIRRIYLASLAADRKYDVYILSDHGQCAVQPFERVAGETLSEYLRRETALAVTNGHSPGRVSRDAVQSATAIMRLAQSMPRPVKRTMESYAHYLRRHSLQQLHPSGSELLDLRVVSTGPIAYVYWVGVAEALGRDQIDLMHPGLIDRLVNHPALGFVSVRAASHEEGDGQVWIFARDGHCRIGVNGILEREGRLPFDSAADPGHVVNGIRRVTLFPRAGDLCIWGGGSALGHISYNDEVGAHSGWTDDEVEAFVLAPAEVDHDFSQVRRHAEFYEFFTSRYCASWAAAGLGGGTAVSSVPRCGEGESPASKVA